MNPYETEKLQRFMMDKVMVDTVFKVFKDSFLKSRKSQDVQYLAAKALAIEFLEDAQRELNKYKTDPKEEDNTREPVGI